MFILLNSVPGITDERRNCISNVRPEGLCFAGAASKLNYLIREPLRRELSGVDLKDEQTTDSIPDVTGAVKISV
jgi:ethanolamine ammonia-lyase small subunit